MLPDMRVFLTGLYLQLYAQFLYKRVEISRIFACVLGIHVRLDAMMGNFEFIYAQILHFWRAALYHE